MRTRSLGTLLSWLWLFIAFAGQSERAFAATEVQRTTFSGSQAQVGFFGSGQLTCADGSMGFVSVTGFLNGAQQIFSTTGTPQTIGNGVYVEIDSFFNTCTGLALSGAGQIVNGFTPPDKKLTSARLAGTAQVQDFGTGATVPITLDVAISGDGTLTSSKANSHTKTVGDKGGPLSITTSHGASSNRSGTASGTMSIDGVAIDPQFFFAVLVANDNTTTTISKL